MFSFTFLYEDQSREAPCFQALRKERILFGVYFEKFTTYVFLGQSEEVLVVDETTLGFVSIEMSDDQFTLFALSEKFLTMTGGDQQSLRKIHA